MATIQPSKVVHTTTASNQNDNLSGYPYTICARSHLPVVHSVVGARRYCILNLCGCALKFAPVVLSFSYVAALYRSRRLLCVDWRRVMHVVRLKMSAHRRRSSWFVGVANGRETQERPSFSGVISADTVKSAVLLRMRTADDDDSRETGDWVAVRQIRIGSWLGRNTYIYGVELAILAWWWRGRK